MNSQSTRQCAISPLRAEIDLGAIAANCRTVRSLIPKSSRFMAVVKADGYGHGAVETARTALDHGADSLAVARLEEALCLRRAGIRSDILIFGSTPPADAELLLRHQLIQTVLDLDSARALSGRAQSLGGTLRVHLKVDTGMGRLGVVAVPGEGDGSPFAPQALEEAERIFSLPGLQVEGIYTHFARADDPDPSPSRTQLERFNSLLSGLRQRGISVPLRHAANSAAVFCLPESHLDLVRPGLMLYGLCPLSGADRDELGLRPALALKARVAQIKQVGPGMGISYGSTHVTQRSTRIATLPMGYADGYNRLLSGQGEVLFRGSRASVVGRICMDQTMVDVGDLPPLETGEEAVALGRQDGEEISAEELARICRTINYEIVTSIPPRVPRIYFHPD